MNSKQKVAKLKNMLNESGHSIYERLQLADECMKDMTWVLDPTGGGEGTKHSRLIVWKRIASQTSVGH